jgi:hypothetical protein
MDNKTTNYLRQFIATGEVKKETSQPCQAE